MNFRKVAPILALLVTTSFFTGCTTNQSPTQQQTEVGVQTQEQTEQQTYTVKVKSIDNQTIVATQGTLTQAGPPEMPDGEKPTGEAPPALPSEDKSGDGAQGTQEAPSVLSSGEKPGDKATSTGKSTTETPQAQSSGDQGTGTKGQPPSDMGGGQTSTFTESSESIRFTVNESTKITIEMLQGTQEGTIDNIGVNDILEITLDKQGIAQSIVVKNLQAAGGFGGSQEVTQGTAANTLDTDTTLSGQTYTSTGDDENALRIENAKVTLEELTIEKLKGESSNTEDGDFYGQNAGLLATDGAAVTIKNATVNTSVTNGNGIFSYGEGTVVNVSDSQIQTSGSNSGGIQTTGGATMNASNLQVETQGNSAAAIRSDRGGGTVKVTGGSYTTNGTGSPAVYSTADISVSDATLVANQSEALVIEGKNTINLQNCNVTGNMDSSHLDESENIHNIMIYQSMSGDATVGHSTFTAQGGSITAKQGDMIYVTNTTCTVDLTGVELHLATDVLLNVAGNTSSRGWGTQGSNGGACTFVATNQTMSGKIKVDAISSLDCTLQQGTNFIGAINDENTKGSIKVTMDTSSKWQLTGDSYLSEFNGDLSQVDTNGFNLYVNGEQVK